MRFNLAFKWLTRFVMQMVRNITKVDDAFSFKTTKSV